MRLLRILPYLIIVATLTSCYSVRFQVSNGQPEPRDDDEETAWAGYNVRTIETTVTRKISTGANYFNITDCESGALHTVEYRNTLGGLLLYVATFGRKKKVKIKYVCIQENSM